MIPYDLSGNINLLGHLINYFPRYSNGDYAERSSDNPRYDLLDAGTGRRGRRIVRIVRTVVVIIIVIIVIIVVSF